jgi:deoxyribonuclease (pyrimidine dimer)
MVRINLVRPEKLSDQHLIAEYNEILMLIGHIKKFPKINNPPKNYTLGKGHINFFKNKIKYLKDRHELIKKEMKIRRFETNKTISLSQFKKEQKENWKPKKEDFKIIKKRIINKIRLKPNYYKYYGKKKNSKFLIDLLK